MVASPMKKLNYLTKQEAHGYCKHPHISCGGPKIFPLLYFFFFACPQANFPIVTRWWLQFAQHCISSMKKG